MYPFTNNVHVDDQHMSSCVRLVPEVNWFIMYLPVIGSFFLYTVYGVKQIQNFKFPSHKAAYATSSAVKKCLTRGWSLSRGIIQ
jgi:hypothetical protein